MVTYGISDEEAGGVGLMCGGTVRVFVHEHDRGPLAALEAVAEARAADQPVALATLLEGDRAGAKMAILADERSAASGSPSCSIAAVARDARGQLDEGLSRIRRYGAGGEVMGSELAVYIQAFSSRREW